jgi:hypothetical protein
MQHLIAHRSKIVLAMAVLACTVGMVWAGSPHFVFVTVTTSANTVTVVGKEAGLGDETQVRIVVNADASCINPGANHPKAANKESFSASGNFPVQNGKADFSLTLTATFQPDCSPPMEVAFTNIVVCDTTHDISSPPGETCIE